VSNGPGFQYALRAEQLAFAPSDQYRAVLQEQRDRELEDYLAPLTVGVTWEPTITQGVALTYTVDLGEYVVQGDWVEGRIQGTFTSAGTAGQPILIDMPFDPVGGLNQNSCGACSFYDASTAIRHPALTDTTVVTGTWNFAMSNAADAAGAWWLGQAGFTLAVASGDSFALSFRYKKA
jgi:hypothetical protein